MTARYCTKAVIKGLEHIICNKQHIKQSDPSDYRHIQEIHRTRGEKRKNKPKTIKIRKG
jgi:hypothetical protein